MKNLIERSIFGLLFMGIMIFAILFDYRSLSLLMILILATGMNEFYQICLGNNFHIQRFLALLSGAFAFSYFLYLSAFGVRSAFLMCAALCILFIPISFIFNREHAKIETVAYVYCGIVYIALPICLSPLLVFSGGNFDGWKLLSMFIMIWSADVGAYCLGSALGQREGAHKLAPDISPKKSWWGFAGALTSGIVSSIVLRATGVLAFPLVHTILTGIVISSAAVAGDLVESLWKRRFSIKDSGHVIPGHGGILDRFDSSLIAIPITCIYLSLFGIL